jgi:hypothetical protein
MKLNLAKTWTGWEAIDERAKAYHKKGQLADVYYLEIKKYQDQRSAKFNAKYWKMLSEVIKNTERYSSSEQLHHDIKWALGITTTEKNEFTGEIITRVGSTDFSKMGAIEFEKFYQNSITLIIKHILTGVTKQELMDRVNHILRFS